MILLTPCQSLHISESHKTDHKALRVQRRELLTISEGQQGPAAPGVE